LTGVFRFDPVNVAGESNERSKDEETGSPIRIFGQVSP
jgi:hypothetical protein